MALKAPPELSARPFARRFLRCAVNCFSRRARSLRTPQIASTSARNQTANSIQDNPALCASLKDRCRNGASPCFAHSGGAARWQGRQQTMAVSSPEPNDESNQRPRCRYHGCRDIPGILRLGIHRSAPFSPLRRLCRLAPAGFPRVEILLISICGKQEVTE